MSLSGPYYYGDPSQDTVRCRCPVGHTWEVAASAYHGHGQGACPYCMYAQPGKVIPVGPGGHVDYVPTQGASYSSSHSFTALQKIWFDEMKLMKPESSGDWLDKEINKVRRLAFAA